MRLLSNYCCTVVVVGAAATRVIEALATGTS